MSRLITPSLISSIDWYKHAPFSWKAKAYEDLTNQLGRIYPPEMPFNVKRGIDFENCLYKYAEKDTTDIKASDLFITILKNIRGGQFQKKTKAFLKIDEHEYCLYGKIDVLFLNKIVDIKTTKSFSPTKYLDSYQHLIYCYNQKMTNFEYHVAIFDNDDHTISDYKIVKYESPGLIELEQKIIDKIKEVIIFIEDSKELSDLYFTKFNLY